LSHEAGPEKFPKNNLGYPSITVKDEEDEAVSLYCTVSLDKKIKALKNVTYHIEWYSEGKLIYTEQPICRPPQGQTENKDSCPGDKKLVRSLLLAGGPMS